MNRPAFAALLALAAMLVATPTATAQTASAQESFAQSSRPRIIISPRRTSPGPNAKRYCRARLVQEARASGTVIVPQTTCWWQ